MGRFNCKFRLSLVLIILVFALVFTGCASSSDPLLAQHKSAIEENLEEWFRGEKLHEYKGNNREYDWYIDQALTGEHSNDNCGPSSAVMAMKWLREDFEGTAVEARRQYEPEGGWWFTSTVTQYFTDQGLEYENLFFDTSDPAIGTGQLKEAIETGSIVLLCIDMGYITRETDPLLRINRFYDYDSGHFLIVKGYAIVDDKTYFEVYDPNNWHMKYNCGARVGKDRYYESNELMDAIYNWWSIGYIISEDGVIHKDRSE